MDAVDATDTTNVTLLATGGTIASTAGDGTEGAAPTEDGADLLATVPDADEYATVTVDPDPVADVPSFEIDAATLEALGDRVAALDDDPAVDAVVVTHGTDTMEESAYYLDAAVAPSTPTLLTGAQRPFDAPNPDGPENLRTAFRAAAAFDDLGDGGSNVRDDDDAEDTDDEGAGGASGVFVAFDESVHAGRTATKRHTSKLAAFGSPDAGPVATLDHAGVWLHRPPTNEADRVPGTGLDATVPLIKSASGVDGSLLDAALDRADGVVVVATGVGNVTRGLGSAIEEAVASVPVVVASRCPGGRTMPVYGSVGGSRALDRYGVVFAGGLTAGKARLKLQLALSAFEDRRAVESVFDGGGPGTRDERGGRET